MGQTVRTVVSRTPVGTVAIVGGGFCGVATAWQLRALAPAGARLQIHLIERQPPVGRGVAYAEGDPGYLLNTPVSQMSLDPAQPGHFLDWLHASGYAAGPADFVPRAWYGRYLEDALRTGWRDAPADQRLILEHGEVVGILPHGDRYALRLADGRELLADHVVLALGLAPPPDRAFGLNLSQAGPWLVRNPWEPAAVAPLPVGSEALVLGTGLTAVDVALALLERAGATRVHMVSRRGALPVAWQPAAHELPALPEPWPSRASQWLHWAHRTGCDGATLVAALRPLMSHIWQSLPWVERRRFLRHAKGLWEGARQRLPVPTAARVEAALSAGRLTVHRGRVFGWSEQGTGVVVSVRGASGAVQAIAVPRVILCTGPESNYRRVRHPLVQSLLGTGLVRVDPFGLGLDVAAGGRLRGEDGELSPRLWGLGSLCKGAAWESTAVPELREQAVAIARGLWHLD